MKKIAFIGAGSFGFTRVWSGTSCPSRLLGMLPLRLWTSMKNALSYIHQAVNRIIKEGEYLSAKVIATTDRVEALKDADGVVITILRGGEYMYGVMMWRFRKKYGIDINVGDTRGTGGYIQSPKDHPGYAGYLQGHRPILSKGHSVELHQSHGHAM